VFPLQKRTLRGSWRTRLVGSKRSSLERWANWLVWWQEWNRLGRPRRVQRFGSTNDFFHTAAHFNR